MLQQLTWQQQTMLRNADAAAFQPPIDGTAQQRPDGVAAQQPRRPPRQRKPGRQAAQAHDQAQLATDVTAEADPAQAREAGAVAGVAPPLCLLCCSPMLLASFGHCNHRAACAACCLRLRMCYANTDCPLCKADLAAEVVVAPWRPDLPDYAFFLDNPELVARSAPGQLGPGTVLVDRWERAGRGPSSRLLHELVGSTALACRLCDGGGRQPFKRRALLERHLRERHGRHACGMCLQEGRTFPLEQPLFESEAALHAHADAAHPRCSFCRGRAFFDGDALWGHMADAHFRCQLCEPSAGGDFAYFADVGALRGHLAAEHFACEDADCTSCLVAFRTAEELRRHCLQQHSARMPRWNGRAARPLQLDIQFVRRPGGEAPADGDEAGRGGRRRRGGRGPAQDVRLQDGGEGVADGGGGGGGGGGGDFTSGGAAGENGPAPERRLRDFPAEYDGGHTFIDDDLGMVGAYDSLPRGAAAAAAGPAAWAARQGRSAPATPQEEFPSLAAAAASSSVADSLSSLDLGGGGGGRRPPPLVKRVLRCPCGRRTSHVVVKEGEEPPGLPCDGVCQLEGRKARLADAFGVDPGRQPDFGIQRRSAVWSGALLAAARRQPVWIQDMERELAAFVTDAAARRHALAPMPRPQRLLAHALAEQYGLATASQGQEPRRYVELYKSSQHAALPTRLLSRVAPTVSEAEIAALLREAEGHPVRIFDVAPTADLAYYLRRWEGRLTIEWERGSEAAVVRFAAEGDRAEALDALGGGIRGLFRIDRAWQPRTALPAGGGGAGGGTAAAPWTPHAEGSGSGSGGGGAGGGGGAPADSWTAVAVAPPPRAPPRARQAEQAQPDNASLPSGWTVISSRGRATAQARAPPEQRAFGGESSDWED